MVNEDDTFRVLKQVPFEVLLRNMNLICGWWAMPEDEFEIYSLPLGWTKREFIKAYYKYGK